MQGCHRFLVANLHDEGSGLICILSPSIFRIVNIQMEQANSPALPEQNHAPEIILSLEQWSQIELEGGIQPAFKQRIIRAIVRYKQRRAASKPTRDKVEQVRAALFKAVMLLVELNESDEFLYIGTRDDGEGAPNNEVLTAWINQTVKVYEEMDKADERFDSGHQRLIFPAYGALEELVFDVLMIQAHSQQKAPPTYYRNSSTNPRFEYYVYLCAQAADSELNADYPNTRNDKIERALKLATDSLKRVRDMDREGWAVNWSPDTLSSK